MKKNKKIKPPDKKRKKIQDIKFVSREEFEKRMVYVWIYLLLLTTVFFLGRIFMN